MLKIKSTQKIAAPAPYGSHSFPEFNIYFWNKLLFHICLGVLRLKTVHMRNLICPGGPCLSLISMFNYSYLIEPLRSEYSKVNNAIGWGGQHWASGLSLSISVLPQGRRTYQEKAAYPAAWRWWLDIRELSH